MARLATSLVLSFSVTLTAPSPAAAQDVHELLAQLGDPKPEVHDAACAALIKMGKAAGTVLNANSNNERANKYHRVNTIIDRINKAHTAGDPWDRARNVIAGRDLHVWREGSTKHIQVTEGERKIYITETVNSIRLEVSTPQCGKPTKETYTGGDAQSLMNSHSGAYDIYRRWGGGVGTRWSVEGHTLEGDRLREKGPIIRRTISRSFDLFREWMRGQMAAAGTPGADRKKIEARIQDALRALNLPNEKRDQKIKVYIEACDALRVLLKKLRLPDPGELLPAPPTVRLGTTTGAEPSGAALIDTVAPGSRGARIGLKPGDIVVEVQGRPVHRRSLAKAIRSVGEERLVLKIRRKGKELSLEENPKKGRRR